MDHTYWHRQTLDKPLFPDLLWSRPENKRLAGKLLIVGGNLHGFTAPATAYNEAVKAGVGTARVLLPDSLQKTVGKVLEAGEYAPSTPSGSFARLALGELLALAGWADAVLLAGDFGRNSETAILLEQFINKYTGQLVLTKDAVDYFAKTPDGLLERSDTTLALSFSQLQQLAVSAHFATPFTFDMDFLRLIDALHDFTQKHPVAIVTKHLQNMFVAFGGQVSTTKLETDIDIWRVDTAAHAAVWWLQNPSKTFEAVSTSIISE
jgi:ADP-dependent NAD(P)H-hydrate dehydratase / NAD(P)H-hydrate epimerase